MRFNFSKANREGILSTKKLLLDSGLTFGIKYLDHACSGIQKNDLIILSGYSGVGKTEMAVNIAETNALNGKKVFFFSLESFHNEIYLRLAFKIASNKYFSQKSKKYIKVNYPDFIRSKMDTAFKPFEEYAYEKLEKKYSNLMVLHRTESGYDIQKFEKDFMESGLDLEADLIIIDHLQYFDFYNKTESQAMSETIKKIRDMVLLHNVPVIVITHLNRPDRKIKRVVQDLDDIYGTSNIGKVCTKAIFISKLDGASVRDGLMPCLIRVGKNRLNQSVCMYAGYVVFNIFKNEYIDNYEIVKLKNFDTEYETLKPENYPEWGDNEGKDKQNTMWFYGKAD